MIIAIDETGDFSPESEKLSFFVAVLLDQHNDGIDIKRQQFNNWLCTIPKEKSNINSEVKGSNLTDEELLSFVNQVYNSDPVVRVEVVCIKPQENTEELLLQLKDIEVRKLFRISEIAKAYGKNQMAKQYERMAIWHKNARKMHYPHFFKLILLRSVITHAFNKMVGVSILLEMLSDKKSENLLKIRIKIDQDFVRGDDPTIYWKELLRSHFISFTRSNPIHVPDLWKANGHPFLEKYKSQVDDELNFNDIFRNHCDFVESHEHFEVQIADIVGIIINRFHNRQRAVDAYNELWTKIKRSPFTKIVLNPNSDDLNIDPQIID